MVQLKAHNLYELILFTSRTSIIIYLLSRHASTIGTLESCMYVYNIRAHTSYDSYVTEYNIILSIILRDRSSLV